MSKIQSYAEFFPHYLREHSRVQTRAVHYIGTAASTGAVIAGLAGALPWWPLVALVAGYGPAWVGHFFIEKNRPATFTYPLWSLISDYRMFGLWITGRLGAALLDAGVGAHGSGQR